MWATDELNGGLSSLDWGSLQSELVTRRSEWMSLIVQHASEEGVFFSTGSDARSDEGEDDMH
jgi:hypothetical protein